MKMIDDIDVAMYNDMVEGANYLYMLKRWLSGAYGNALGASVEVDEDEFNDRYTRVIKHLRENIEQLDDDERSKMYGRYLALYKMASDGKNVRDARAVLDSMSKLQGLSDTGKSVTVKQNKEDDVVEIKFNFG